jgi:hypothetical protein
VCQFAKKIWEEIKSSFGISLNLQGFCNIKQWVLDWLSIAKSGKSSFFLLPSGTFGKSGMMFVMVNLLPILNNLSEKLKAYVEMIVQHSVKLKCAPTGETMPPTSNWCPPPLFYELSLSLIKDAWHLSITLHI